MVGTARGIDLYGVTMFGSSYGQETIPTYRTIVSGRAPTSKELSLWSSAERAKQKTALLAHLVKIQYRQIVFAAKFGQEYGLELNEPEMASLESRMFSVTRDIEKLRQDHCAVNGMSLGVRLSASGNDLDIVNPTPSQLGLAWVPIAIGAVVVAGIIARWAFLEKEVQTISDKYNGIIHRADQALCKDPNSAMCKDWKKRKQSGGYVENVTLIDSVKNAVGKVGGFAAGGIGAGLMLAIPVLMMLYAPRPKRQTT